MRFCLLSAGFCHFDGNILSMWSEFSVWRWHFHLMFTFRLKSHLPDCTAVVLFSSCILPFLPAFTHLHLSDSPTCCLSWATCAFLAAIYYLLTRLIFVLPPHRGLLHLLTLVLSNAVSPHLITELLPDWQISIILEDLHKSLPSHFLAQMAFVPICSDSDHTEAVVNAAVIPVISTDTTKEEIQACFVKVLVVFQSFFPGFLYLFSAL